LIGLDELEVECFAGTAVRASDGAVISATNPTN